MALEHWGCVHNADRSNFTGLGLGPCGGELQAYVNPTQLELLGRLAVLWACDLHAQEREFTPWPTA